MCEIHRTTNCNGTPLTTVYCRACRICFQEEDGHDCFPHFSVGVADGVVKTATETVVIATAQNTRFRVEKKKVKVPNAPVPFTVLTATLEVGGSAVS